MAAEWVRPHVLGIVGLSIFAWLLSNMQSIHRYSLVKLPAEDLARYMRLKNCLQRITLRSKGQLTQLASRPPMTPTNGAPR
ncbi:hypothetical protein EMIT0P44_20273 [Pseudomonas sp. IT-P44]